MVVCLVVLVWYCDWVWIGGNYDFGVFLGMLGWVLDSLYLGLVVLWYEVG